MFNKACEIGNPPIIQLIGANPLVVDKDGTYADPGYTATDIQDGDITAQVTIVGIVNTAITGVYTIVYNVTDSDGNAHSVTRKVVVAADCNGDNPPVITLIGGDTITIPQDSGNPPTIIINGSNPLTINQGDVYNEPGFVATDIEDGDITAGVVSSGNVNSNATGTYTLLYTATDSHGNNATASRTVIVAAVNVPLISLIGANTPSLLQGSAYTEQGATATDIEDGDITANIVVTGTVDHNTPGTYVITYTVTDTDNHTVSTTRTVTVNPNTVPVISLIGNNTGQILQGNTYTEQGATASDAEDGDITASIITSGSVDHTTPGNYVITYSVTDSHSNSVTETRTITVAPNNVPTITIIGGAVDVIRGTTYVEQGANAADAEDGSLTASIVITSNVDESTVGSYLVTYTVTDSDNNTVSETRVVNVLPSVPVFTFSDSTVGTKSSIISNVTQIFTLGAGIVSDLNIIAVDGNGVDITGNIVVGGYVAPTSNHAMAAGSYQTTMDVVDENGTALAQLVVEIEVAYALAFSRGFIIPADGGISSALGSPSGSLMEFTKEGAATLTPPLSLFEIDTTHGFRLDLADNDLYSLERMINTGVNQYEFNDLVAITQNNGVQYLESGRRIFRLRYDPTIGGQPAFPAFANLLVTVNEPIAVINDKTIQVDALVDPEARNGATTISSRVMLSDTGTPYNCFTIDTDDPRAITIKSDTDTLYQVVRLNDDGSSYSIGDSALGFLNTTGVDAKLFAASGIETFAIRKVSGTTYTTFNLIIEYV